MQSPYAEPLSLLMAGDVADVGLPDDCGPVAHTCTSAVSLGYHGYIKQTTRPGRSSSTRRGSGKRAWRRTRETRTDETRGRHGYAVDDDDDEMTMIINRDEIALLRYEYC